MKDEIKITVRKKHNTTIKKVLRWLKSHTKSAKKAIKKETK